MADGNTRSGIVVNAEEAEFLVWCSHLTQDQRAELLRIGRQIIEEDRATRELVS